MAVVLIAVGLFVYSRVGSDLDAALDNSLRSRADDLAAAARATERLGSPDQDRLVASDESLAQVIGPGGRVVYSSAGLGGSPLLRSDELARARRGPLFVNRDSVAGFDERVRLLARPTDSGRDRGGRHPRGPRGGARRRWGRSCSPAGRSRCCSPRSPATGSPRPRCGPWARCAARPRRSRASAAAGACPCRPPATSSRSSAGRSTRCSSGWRSQPSASAASWQAQATSCAPRWRCSRRSWSWRCARAARAEELRDAVASAAGESDRLVQLAEDLLVLARADEGRLPVRPERLDTAELLVVHRPPLRVAGRRGRPGAAGACRATAWRCMRIGCAPSRRSRTSWTTRFGTAMARSSWLRSASDGAVRLHVRDRGPGFDPALDGHAFERFTRGDRARSRGGTGLGLGDRRRDSALAWRAGRRERRARTAGSRCVDRAAALSC